MAQFTSRVYLSSKLANSNCNASFLHHLTMTPEILYFLDVIQLFSSVYMITLILAVYENERICILRVSPVSMWSTMTGSHYLVKLNFYFIRTITVNT
jgi:hypothetical protein